MDRIDIMLESLRDDDVPAGLAGIDGAVMDGLSARRERDFTRRGMMLAACIAASAGLALGLDRGAPVSDEPLLGVPMTAPSHLLYG